MENLGEPPYEYLSSQLGELFVPGVESGFDQPVTNSDYKTYLEDKAPLFKKLSCFIDTNDALGDVEKSRKFKRKLLSPALIICGQHSSANDWTSELTLNESQIILNGLLRFFDYESVPHSLTDDQCFIFKDILAKMRSWLLKESWKKYPSATVCFAWLLNHVKSPHLGENLSLVLPTALIFTDDFESKNKVVGLECLEHIINNVGMTQLSWFNQEKVILDAIKPLFYIKEVEIIQPLISVFVTLLNKKYPLKAHPFLQFNEYDELIDKFLQNMILEQKLNLRSVCISALPCVIEARGLGMILHSTNIIQIITEYILEPTSAMAGLNVLQLYIGICWPRIKPHCDTFLIVLCKTCLGCERKRFPEECKDLAIATLKQLQKLCPERVNTFFNTVGITKSLEPFSNILAGNNLMPH